MKKFIDVLLNVALIFGLTFLILSFFNKPPELKKGLQLDFASSSYAVPASPVLTISNYTDADIPIDTCKDFEVRSPGGEKIPFTGDVCKQLMVKKGEQTKLSYANDYEKFVNFGEYTLKANIQDKEFIKQIRIHNKGSIEKIFSSILYAPVYNLVVWLIELFSHSFGWAIVIVTIIIRLLLLYPQHKMMVSQRKMQALQPKMKALQEKYKNDKQQLGLKVMELYKKENVSPFGSCGILLIQMPILLVVYNVIMGIQNPANGFYLYDFLKNFDVSKIDPSFFGLQLLESGGMQGIILAVVIAAIQFLQIKLSMSYNKIDTAEKKKGVVLEKKKGENDYSQMMPDQETMNKVLLIGMPVMVGVFTFTLFAGIGLYWGIGTLFMLIQQLVVNKIVKK